MKKEISVIIVVFSSIYLMAQSCDDYQFNEDVSGLASEYLRCKSDESRNCLCEDGAEGIQYCSPEGGEWELCICKPRCIPTQEICDDVDNDCDGQTDEGAGDALTWYADRDNDEHGSANEVWISCQAPQGYVESNDDQDDLCPTCWNDCDGPCEEDTRATLNDSTEPEPATDTVISLDSDSADETSSDTYPVEDTDENETSTSFGSDFVVQSIPDNLASAQWINERFRIQNNTSSEVPLNEFSLNYYFTGESGTSLPGFDCWSGPCSLGEIFPYSPSTNTADFYLQLSDMSGTIPSGAFSQEFVIGISHADWTAFIQDNDWSFLDVTSYTDNPHITLYRNDSLVWGQVPVQ